jgi:dTDP-glucose 4,6-dehydratase
VYGAGNNVRDWLYVGDHAAALVEIMERGRAGRSYNVGGNEERTNIDVVKAVCRILDAKVEHDDIGNFESLIEFVTDRPGHDQRYAIDATRIAGELGWKPVETFESGMDKTVEWYLKNQAWVEKIQEKNELKGKRLGSVGNSGGDA